jgi:hypothetical protein
MQRTPAGFPFGIPGIREEIDGAMQQAPQPERQSVWVIGREPAKKWRSMDFTGNPNQSNVKRRNSILLRRFA